MTEPRSKYRLPRHPLDRAPKQTEAQFEAAVLQVARALGWKTYHTRYSLHSTAGYPDLCLLRPPRLVYAELKRDARPATEAQAEWLLGFNQCPGVEAYRWDPTDWPRIEQVLAR